MIKHEKQTSSLKGKKILLVDDEKDILDCLTDIFEPLGCILYTAHHGKRALEIIKSNSVLSVSTRTSFTLTLSPNLNCFLETLPINAYFFEELELLYSRIMNLAELFDKIINEDFKKVVVKH